MIEDNDGSSAEREKTRLQLELLVRYSVLYRASSFDELQTVVLLAEFITFLIMCSDGSGHRNSLSTARPQTHRCQAENYENFL